jgi:hypothetical protein
LLDETKEPTDLGGDPITLRASISMLSVLLLVSDSELEDAGGSIGRGMCAEQPGKETKTQMQKWICVADAHRTEGPDVCSRKKSIY